MILAHEGIIKKYLDHGSYSGNELHGFYGTIIISKYPCKFYEKTFIDSNQGRALILAESNFDVPLIVSTAHFESVIS